jgi:ssDNA-binding Zn-finger/Zn-ribbon topoisomerase 1
MRQYDNVAFGPCPICGDTLFAGQGASGKIGMWGRAWLD